MWHLQWLPIWFSFVRANCEWNGHTALADRTNADICAAHISICTHIYTCIHTHTHTRTCTHTMCTHTHNVHALTHTHTAKKPNTIPWHNRTEIINDPNKISMKRCKSFNLHWRLGGKKLTDTTIYELVTPQTWMRLLSISRYSWSTCTCPLYTSTHFRLYTQTFVKQLAHIWIRTTSESPIWKRLVRARKSPAVNESCICEPSTRARLRNVRLQNVLDRIFIDEDGDRETDDGWQPNSDESEEEEEVSELVGKSGNNTALLAQDASSVNFATSSACSS